MTYVDGSSYEGNYEKGQRHGYGTWEGNEGNIKR